MDPNKRHKNARPCRGPKSSFLVSSSERRGGGGGLLRACHVGVTNIKESKETTVT